MPPSTRRHAWFTFHQDRPAVKNRHRLGGVHLMWASHFPFDESNFPDNRQQAMRAHEVPAKSGRRWATTSHGSTVCRVSKRALRTTRSAFEQLSTLARDRRRGG